MSRGRIANHVYVDAAAPSSEHAAIKPDAIRPPTSVELLERILANESAPRSATTQHRLDEDPASRLRAASARYRAAVESAPGAPGVGDGPLPWLPAMPATDDATWGDYLARRFDLVRELAAEVPVADTLPGARWATQLQRQDPDLAQHVAVWRAAHDVPTSDFRPCGPPITDGAVHHQQLEAKITALVGPMLGPTDRWKAWIDDLAPELVHDPHWPVLAASLDRADRAGSPRQRMRGGVRADPVVPAPVDYPRRTAPMTCTDPAATTIKEETTMTSSIPAMLTVPQAARLLGIGRTLAYELVRTGAWPKPIVRVGRLIKIPSAPLLELLAIGRVSGAEVA
jgi:excisionase family DNA binding protein